jgi:LPS O-antigen subunit length determinant protein (WzzB/FepE family)
MISMDKTKAKAIDFCKNAEIIHAPTDTTLKKWVKTKINFVSQIGAAGSNSQILIEFSTGKKQTKKLVVGNKQLLLMSDEKLKEAKRIASGDKLMQSDGTAALVISATAGKFSKLTTYLATSVAPASEPAGHLLVLNGIVAGDYALSLGIDSKYLSRESYVKKQPSAKKKR